MPDRDAEDEFSPKAHEVNASGLFGKNAWYDFWRFHPVNKNRRWIIFELASHQRDSVRLVGYSPKPHVFIAISCGFRNGYVEYKDN